MRKCAEKFFARREVIGGRRIEPTLPLALAMILFGPVCAPTPVERYVERKDAAGNRGSEDPGDNPGSTNGGAAGTGEDPSSTEGDGGAGGSKTVGGIVPLPDASQALPVDAAICGNEHHKLERVMPEIVLVLDRSESMLSAGAQAGMTRWSEITTALLEILNETNGKVHWGFKTFPTSGQCTVGPTPEVEIGPSVTPIADAMQAGLPKRGFGTPTAGAIKAATAYLQTRTTSNPKYIILATDDEPTCTIAAGPMRTVEAVAAAKTDGISTFVVGTMAEPAADAILNTIAEAGGFPRKDARKYYPAANGRDLLAVIADITRQVTTCTFPLNVEPPASDNMVVSVGGVYIPRDDSGANGWSYEPATRAVRLHGPACAGLKDSQAETIDVILGCKITVVM